jgi:hypothetical protein
MKDKNSCIIWLSLGLGIIPQKKNLAKFKKKK